MFEALLQGWDLEPLLRAGQTPHSFHEFQGLLWTPLHLAVFLGRERQIRLLLEAGANPNTPAGGESGLTPLDLAVSLDRQDLSELLIEAGGRPGCLKPGEEIRQFLERAGSVEAAERLVLEAHWLPRAERALLTDDWMECERILREIARRGGEGERARHLRIRCLIQRGLSQEALEEASLIFALYRQQGRSQEALQVCRAMRHIAPLSGRAYELEMEFLLDLGWTGQARRCLEQLTQLYLDQQQPGEAADCRVRFGILLRRPGYRERYEAPRHWVQGRDSGSVAASGNLPALAEEDKENGSSPWWQSLRRLWWG